MADQPGYIVHFEEVSVKYEDVNGKLKAIDSQGTGKAVCSAENVVLTRTQRKVTCEDCIDHAGIRRKR